MKHKIIRVTMTQDFIVPVAADGSTVNGWTIDELMKDWFEKPRMYHATRDSHKVGLSEKVLSHEVLDMEDAAR